MKSAEYQLILEKIDALIANETDLIAAMSTIVCELHHSIAYFHWTGFYRQTEPDVLKVGPYQGSHGCLMIPFSKGVCGKSARTGETQIVKDVREISDHIACSASTISEIVVPIFDNSGNVRAVLDIDSDNEDAFDDTDAKYLQQIAKRLQRFY